MILNEDVAMKLLTYPDFWRDLYNILCKMVVSERSKESLKEEVMKASKIMEEIRPYLKGQTKLSVTMFAITLLHVCSEDNLNSYNTFIKFQEDFK